MTNKGPARAILESFAQPLYQIYSSSLRKWKYQDLDFIIMPGIFHPGWFVTSKMLFEWLENTDVGGKKFLELGCGTGSLACTASAHGARAFASDILVQACRNAELNAERNDLAVKVFHSDIFEQIDPESRFDFICVNPPFIPRYPDSEDDFAFCCGEQYEYYISLFSGVKQHLTSDGELIMALAKSCDLERILEIADFEGLKYERISHCRKWAETNFIFRFST
jgi:release factor glutamine methyltransferase